MLYYEINDAKIITYIYSSIRKKKIDLAIFQDQVKKAFFYYNYKNMSNKTIPQKAVKRKSYPKRSWTWEYFTENKDDSSAKCNKCGRFVSRESKNTKGLIQHLKLDHAITHESHTRLTLEENNQIDEDLEVESDLSDEEGPGEGDGRADIADRVIGKN